MKRLSFITQFKIEFLLLFNGCRKVLGKMPLLGIVKILKEHILNELKKSRAKKISKVAESVKNNVDSGGKIWRLKKKEQNPH